MRVTLRGSRRFRRSIIRDLLFEVRIFTRINPRLALEAEQSLLGMEIYPARRLP